MDLLTTKVLSLILVLVLTLVFGLLPLKIAKLLHVRKSAHLVGISLKKKRRYETITSSLLCFGGGVLLATCLIHLLPEVREFWEVANGFGILPTMAEFPAAEFLMCLGFFLTYLLEEIIHACVTRKKKRKQLKLSVTLTSIHDQMGDGDFMGSDKSSLSNMELGDSDVKTGPSQQNLLRICPSTDSLPIKNPISESSIPKVVQKVEHCESHNHNLPPTAVSSLRSFLVIVALSFHSVFEGLAIGLQETVLGVWFLCLAVSVHKFVIAFCVGLEIRSKGTKVRALVMYMCTYASMTPIGMGIGIVITYYITPHGGTQALVLTILQGLASGTLLYVTFFEILETERNKPSPGLIKLVFIILGFVLMNVITFLGHKHDHSREGHAPVDPHHSHYAYSIDHPKDHVDHYFGFEDHPYLTTKHRH